LHSPVARQELVAVEENADAGLHDVDTLRGAAPQTDALSVLAMPSPLPLRVIWHV